MKKEQEDLAHIITFLIRGKTLLPTHDCPHLKRGGAEQ